jgi:hypothetical protein
MVRCETSSILEPQYGVTQSVGGAIYPRGVTVSILQGFRFDSGRGYCEKPTPLHTGETQVNTATIADVKAAIDRTRQWDLEPRKQFRIEELLLDSPTDDEGEDYEIDLSCLSRKRKN